MLNSVLMLTQVRRKSILETRRFAAMSITLEIRPEVEAELSRKASLSGRDLAGYVVDLLESAVHKPAYSPLAPDDDPDFGKKLIAVCAMVRGLTDDVDFSRDRSTTWRPLDIA